MEIASVSIFHEIYQLSRNIDKLSQNQAVLIDFRQENGISYVKVQITPNSGYYEGGKVIFKIYLDCTFPAKPPRVWCCTTLYHPNIDTTDRCSDSNVCLSMFESDGWSPSYGLEGCVMGLLYLMHNPNLDEPLSPYFSPDDDEQSFEVNVRASLKKWGGEVDGVRFEGNRTDPCDTLEDMPGDSS